jgi:hypothetical protein
MRFILGFILLFSLACGGLLGSPLEQSERSYRWRIEDYTELQQRSANEPALNKEINQSLRRFEKKYDALPVDSPAREEALGAIHSDMRDAIWDFEEKLDVIEKEGLAVAMAEAQAVRANFNGTWVGDRMTMTIEPGGQVHYESTRSGMNKSIDAPLQNFTKQSFDVGILGITTTFKIQELPHNEGGTWKMNLDGVELTRQ